MDIFETIESRIRALPAGSPRALLLLDIDDTLIDCRHRKRQVFLDFVAQGKVLKQFPVACDTLSRITQQEIEYRVADNLKKVGIDEPSFAEQLLQFWLDHYFTYPYLIQDIAFPGAVSFVNKCYQRGLGLVYLTGRDLPGMGPGTFAAMKKLGFPCEQPHIHFLLKPDPKIPDLGFKISALEDVAALGPVVAAFENELSNLNAMALRYPTAAMYWRNTLYAPSPPPPHPHVEVLAHFP